MKKTVLNKDISKMRSMMGLKESVNEMNVSYEPSKIDEFVVEAKKDVELGKNLINKFGSMMINLSLITIFENFEQMKAAQEKISSSQKYLEKKFGKFFDIVEFYEVGEYPDNVIELDRLSSQIDDLSIKLSEIVDAFEDLITMTEKISRYNKDLFNTQNPIE